MRKGPDQDKYNTDLYLSHIYTTKLKNMLGNQTAENFKDMTE